MKLTAKTALIPCDRCTGYHYRGNRKFCTNYRRPYFRRSKP